MRILFFTQYFWPENFRINEIVENYKDQKNTILTSYPSYPTYKNFKTFSRNQKQNLTNARIFRMPVIPRSSSNVLILLNYLSFIVVSFFYTFFVFLRRKIDLVFIFCPSPILSAIPLILINKIFKKKVAIWVLDLWPDTIIDLKIIKNKLLISILKKIVKYIYNNCNLILAQSEAIKKEIESVTKTKCVYFPSWPEEKISEENLNFDEIKDKSNFGYLRIMFTGNIGEAQSFETMIKAASILKKKVKVEWFIIGDGRWKKKLKSKIIEFGLQSEIKLFNSVPITKIKSCFDRADVLYLSLKDNPTFRKTIPGKLQTYMSSGKPIIASISGEAYNLINNANCGLVSEAEDYEGLANNILKFINFPNKHKIELGNNGLNYSKKYFNKKHIFKTLENELLSI